MLKKSWAIDLWIPKRKHLANYSGQSNYPRRDLDLSEPVTRMIFGAPQSSQFIYLSINLYQTLQLSLPRKALGPGKNKGDTNMIQIYIINIFKIMYSCHQSQQSQKHTSLPFVWRFKCDKFGFQPKILSFHSGLFISGSIAIGRFDCFEQSVCFKIFIRYHHELGGLGN